jgi:hypothetical protein
MSLPRQRKILREDVKDAPDWINKIIDPLNNFMETVYNILNGNVNFRNHIACNLREIEVITLPTYDETNMDTFRTVRFPSGLRTRAYGLHLVAVREIGGNYTPITKPIFINWFENQGEIVIPLIVGLKPETRYIMNLMVF